jgi:hypothetical protein
MSKVLMDEIFSEPKVELREIKSKKKIMKRIRSE